MRAHTDPQNIVFNNRKRDIMKNNYLLLVHFVDSFSKKAETVK